MLALIGSLIFAGAMATSVAVVWVMIAPQWQRIASLALGRPERSFAPLSQLAVAERRIAVRRWAARSAPAPLTPLRAAA